MNEKANIENNSSPEGNIAPSTLRTISSFAGFATETYLGKEKNVTISTVFNLFFKKSLCVLVNAYVINAFDLVFPFVAHGDFWI